MAAPDGHFGDFEELAGSCADGFWSVKSAAIACGIRIPDVRLDSVERDAIVKDHPTRADSANLAENFTVVPTECRGNRASEEDILVRVDQQDRLEGAAKRVDIVSQFRDRQLGDLDPLRIIEMLLQVVTGTQCGITQVDSHRPLARGLAGRIEDEEAL